MSADGHQERETLPRWPSVCPHDCPSTCALEVELLSPTRIGRIRGAKENSYTAGVICAKVARYAERQHHPDRLAFPMRRIGEKGRGIESFARISWQEALDEIADRFQMIEKEWGAEAIFPYFYAGTMGLVQRDGIERLRYEKRYSRQKSTICVALSDAGWMAGAGVMRGTDPREIPQSDLIVVWGTNPVATQVNVMTHIAKARKERGARLVVVDPYRTGTAAIADEHIMLRPGSDAALAVAVMHVLFAEGYADRDYMARYTDGWRELEAHVRSRSPEWAEAITGVPADIIRQFARSFGSTKRSYIRLGYGFSRSRNGAMSLFAVSCLPAITGSWAEVGGGALYSNRSLFKIDDSLITGSAMRDLRVRELDQSRLGPILTGDPHDLGKGPPVKAMLVQNTNPMMVCPETTKVRAGFQRDDLFVAVHEQFMTETAAMADIVLPATTFLEHEDIYKASGQTHLQVTRAVLSPFAEAKPNHFVISELAKRLGCTHPGFQMTAWEIIDKTLAMSGYPSADEMAEKKWLDCAVDFRTAHFLDGFGHADKKFHFKADWAKIGADHAPLSALPDYIDVIDRADSDRPFRLVTAPARQFLNSTFSETPTSIEQENRPALMLHSKDAKALSIVDGGKVRVGNHRGEIWLHARLFDGVLPGIVVIEGIWPNAAFGNKQGSNTLTSADAGYPNGGGVFHDTAVWVKAGWSSSDIG